MQIGMIGLGRMGAGLVARLVQGGHTCVVHDASPERMAEAVALGAISESVLAQFVNRLVQPRLVWLMVPAGRVDALLQQLMPLLHSGDQIVDGGNSSHQDDLQRAAMLAQLGIAHVDVGTSGGLAGAQRGYCLMVGGTDAAVQRIAPALVTLAGTTAHPGWLHCGPNGAGHFVKMVHNGIEYALMAAYAEGFNLLHHANAGVSTPFADAETAPLAHPERYRYAFDLPQVAQLWRHGSVISSWLLDLTAGAFAASPVLADYAGRVADSGEGRWAVQAAIDVAVPVPVLSAALFSRFTSRGGNDFANQLQSAMRHAFGGHPEVPAPAPPAPPAPPASTASGQSAP